MEPGSGADHRTIPEQASDERPGESRATGMAKAMEKEVSWTSRPGGRACGAEAAHRNGGTVSPARL